jgi:hypothetical protein
MRSILVAVLLALASMADAGSYTLTTTAAQDTRLERARLVYNAAECARVNLPATCTQAQADSAALAQGVVPAPDVPSTTAAFVRSLLVADVKELTAKQDDEDRNVCTAIASAPGANWGEACKLLGLAPGCGKPASCTP